MMDYVPTPEQILAGLIKMANECRLVAIIWHVFFAIIIGALIIGLYRKKTNRWYLTKRAFGIFLGLPALSVGIVSCFYNPVNAIVGIVIGALLLLTAVKFSSENVQLAPKWAMIPGIFMVIFGWIYPSALFMDLSSIGSYVFATPLGLIPCTTLSIIIGLTLLLNGLNSRRYSLIVGITGIVYGILGVVQLGVLIDVVLFIGACVLTINAIRGKYNGIKII